MRQTDSAAATTDSASSMAVLSPSRNGARPLLRRDGRSALRNRCGDLGRLPLRSRNTQLFPYRLSSAKQEGGALGFSQLGRDRGIVLGEDRKRCRLSC